MSVRVMTAVWDIDLPDSEKIVLLALADSANDEGWCWPSMATLARKCSKTDRTVQGAIRDLCAAGHLTRIETRGKGCRYQVHPRKDFAPEATSPPKPVRTPPKSLRDTPEAASDKPSKNHKYPSEGGARPRATTAPVSNPDNGKGAGTAGAGRKQSHRPVHRTARRTTPDQDGAHQDSAQQERATRLPDDWTPPAVADLPPLAAAMVEQWPDGAYAAACETFRLHWVSETRQTAWKRDWLAALGKWLITDHARVMRDAKAGVSFTQAPLVGKAKGKPAKPVAAQRRECTTSALLREELTSRLGVQVFGQWFDPAALVFDGDRLVVVSPSEFTSNWVREHFTNELTAAARHVTGRDLTACFESEKRGRA